ncbi:MULTISPECIES: Sec-independent protein translocase subunit TatA [Microbacteriaceae]|jgi:sec-independent protein translocase protein TatA|uniref:Sec-independent protein translocase subunit TatA n=1 Tax=Microbacteriaceae TaxID=85023 RepID=UPI0003815C8E|nr:MULTISPECIES: Sec-independent protein translocase subunit TatA [Microbacteriaceae]TDQ03890.1 sec-independent protein translocase protein TatA [Leifsonia sp. 115AMFTsu3.1]
MFAGLTGWHLLIILAVILLLFGAPKLPALAKSIGQSMRIFKGEVDELKKDGKDGKSDQASDGTATTPTAQSTAAPTVTPAPAPVDPSTESNPKP